MSRFKDPFFPSRPVQDPSYFEGRKDQIDEIVDALYQTYSDNPKHFVITGDRGIGKSSLLVQARLLASGNNTLTDKFDIELGVDKFNFIHSWTDAVDRQTLENLASNILSNLQSNMRNFLGDLKFSIDLGGFLQISKKEDGAKSIADIVEEFCNRIADVHKKLGKKGKHGIILFIDELDKINPDSGIATFFKLTTEKLVREGLNNIVFACSGITGAIQKLEDEHQSIFRTFRDIPLPRFTKEETKEILTTGFQVAGFTYDDAVIAAIHLLSAGFPEPTHVLGSEILSVSDDQHLDMADFEKARLKVITDVRRNKLKDLLKKAGYGKYQRILEAMANYNSENVPLDHIAKHLKQEQNQFSTNIGQLKEKGIIIQIDRGVYAFADPLLKEYIKNFGIINTEKEEDDI